MELAGACEQAVGHQRMQVRVEVQVFAEGAAGHDNAGESVGLIERGAPSPRKATAPRLPDLLPRSAAISGRICLELVKRLEKTEKW